MDLLIILFMFGSIFGLLGLGTFLLIKIRRDNLQQKRESTGYCAFDDQEEGIELKLTAITGLILVYRIYKFNRVVCKRHARTIYYENQQHNILKGWWSMRGIIRVPLILIGNLNEYMKYKKVMADGQKNGIQIC